MRIKMPQLLLLLPLFPLCLLVGGRVPYFLLYVFLGVMLLPLVHGIIGLYSLKLTVEVPKGKLMVGEEIKLSYRVENPLGLSFPHLKVHHDLAGQCSQAMEGGVESFSLGPKDRHYGERFLTLKRRGAYQMGTITLEIHDPLGIYALRRSFPVPLTLTIYPRVSGLEQLQVKASQLQGELPVQNPLFQDGVTLISLKPYQPGDPIKRIHWKASARGRELLVKSFEERGDTGVYVLLNSTAQGYALDQEHQVEDRLVEIALSLIDYCLKGGLGVTLVYEQGEGLREIKGSHSRDYQGFLDGLVSFSPQGKMPFAEVIERVRATIPQGNTLFILTPQLPKPLAIQGIQMKMENLEPVYFVVEPPKPAGTSGDQEEALKKVLQGEGISLYVLRPDQELRKVLEGFYGVAE